MYPSSVYSFSPIGMKLCMDTPWDPAVGRVALCCSGFALRAKRVMGQRGKKEFFLMHFYVVQSISSRLRCTFSKIFVSAKRKTCASKARCERDVSAKPEEAKRPSSPARLAGRSA